MDLEYDGTDFWGWQIQPGSRTVQGEMEAVLFRLLGSPVGVIGAGRTDRGCHAVGQVAHFDHDRPWPPAELARALAALLPADIRLRALSVAPPGFHARFSATERAYRYLIARRGSTFTRRYMWQLGERLDLDSLRAASACLLGEHDFRGFALAQNGRSGPARCRVERADWDQAAGGYRFTIVADRFLTRMVRLLVGALVEVGRGRLDPAAVAGQLRGLGSSHGSRPAAAPAAGLCLAWVHYDGGNGL
jgi:tRNA pseudouridine38-40 synthase